MTTERELLPCPFCGGAARLQSDAELSPEPPLFYVICEGCFAESPSCADGGKFAVSHWNRRAALAQPAPQYASPEDYARQNPLGGVARVFEVIAERLRAGENYDAVLWDYGLQRAALAQPVAQCEACQIIGPLATCSKCPQPAPVAELSDAECDAIADRLFPRGGGPGGTVTVPQRVRQRALIRAGRATVAEDAARYRFWRKHAVNPDEPDLFGIELGADPPETEADIDAAIDAARGKP